MRTICIFNHKGGVAKTTTAINIAAGLSRKDKKVLLIDLDPQGNVDTSLQANSDTNLYDAVTGKQDIQQSIINIAKNFDVITSKETLTKVEYFLTKDDDSRMMLRDMLNKITGYDYIIVDCPPSLGLLNQNALAYAKEAFIPVATDFLGYDALLKIKGILNEIRVHYNGDIKVTRIIPTLYDQRNKICKDMLSAIQSEYPEIVSYPIRMNSKLKESPMHGKSIFSYDKSSIGAKDYGRLVDDIVSMEGLKTTPVATEKIIVTKEKSKSGRR